MYFLLVDDDNKTYRECAQLFCDAAVGTEDRICHQQHREIQKVS